MKFLKGPEYDSVRLFLFFSLIVFTGYFIYGLAGNNALSQAGNILEATRDTNTLGSGVTTDTVVALNKEIERLNNVRTSDAWYIWEPRKKRAEKSLTETLAVRGDTIGLLATEGKTVDLTEISLSENLVALLPEVAQEEIEAPDTITGELYTEHVDDFENEENSYFRSFVVTNNGKRYDILPTKEIEFARASVTVSGKISGSTIIGNPVPTKIKSSIHSHTHTGETAKMEMPGGEDEAVATNKVAVFLVRYEDTGDVFFTPEEADEIFFGSPFDEFYKEQSYNQIDFYGDVYGWVNIPRESDPWSVSLWGGELDEYLIENDIDLSSYDHIVIYNDSTSGVYSGFSTVGPVNIDLGGEEYSISYAQLQFKDSEYADQYYYYGEYPFPFTKLDYVLSHEIGHSLGLRHANGLDCGVKAYNSYSYNCEHVEYGNKFDVMGGAFALHFNGWYKDVLGWLSPTDVQIIDETGDYTINVLEDMGSSKKYAQVRSPDPEGESIIYTIEYRKAMGFDGQLANDIVTSNQAGLFINRMYHSASELVDDSENQYTQLLDLQPADTPWYADVKRVTLRADKVFYDEANNIKIGPILAISPTSIQFHVEMPETDCTRRPPKLYADPDYPYTYSPYYEGGEGGGAFISLPITIVNRDTVFCGDSSSFEYSLLEPPVFDYLSFGGYSLIRSDHYDDTYLSFSLGEDIPEDGVYPITIVATNTTSGLSGVLEIPIVIE